MKKDINFFFWSRIHTLPRFCIEWWQLKELKRVAIEAYNHISLYQELLDGCGVKPADVMRLADIRKLPITSKKLFRKHPANEWMHDGFRRGLYEWHQTSGATGEPFRFPRSIKYDCIRRFRYYPGVYYAFRFLRWQGMRLEDIEQKIRVAQIRITPTDKTSLFFPIADLRNDPRGTLLRLKKFKPHILDSVPTVLVELARLAENTEPELRPQIPYVVSHGETLLYQQRRFIERVFGGEVFNLYGLEEVLDVGVECKEHNGFHVHEESFIAEAVDDDGNGVMPGEDGRIVVTHFYNSIMPLIRYDTGDEGRIISEPCPCGLRTKRLKVNGRRGLFLKFGNKKFHHLEFEGVMRNFSGSVLRYQIAKTRENGMEIRIIPGAELSPKTLGELKARFSEKLGRQPEIKIVNEIPCTERGKTKAVIDESSFSGNQINGEHQFLPGEKTKIFVDETKQ